MFSRICAVTQKKLSYQRYGCMIPLATKTRGATVKAIELTFKCLHCENSNFLKSIKDNLDPGRFIKFCNLEFSNSIQIRSLHNIANSNNNDKRRGTSTRERLAQIITDTETSLPNEKTPKVIYYEASFISEEHHRLFVSPKNKLHSLFSVLAGELKNKSFEVSPSYKSLKQTNKSSWLCTYALKWPEEIKFIAKDVTKVKASHKAALAALVWLRQQNKITDNAMPLVYDKEEVKAISRKTLPSLQLDEQSMEKVRTIVEMYDKNVAPQLIAQSVTKEQQQLEDIDLTEPDDINFKMARKQRYLGLNQYLSREKVKLPIADYKNEFMHLLGLNQVIIVKGEPGCGKSTRVPQYVLESWAENEGVLGQSGRIVVTQPRRIAAISLAQRVSSERDEQVGHIVGYQVRLNSNFNPHTGRVLYCTTGILLRHLQSDPKLTNFSHIILDEAHERDVNTDLLMNLLRSAVKHNPKLKLIVMSATIDTSLFSDYFGGVPIMEIPGFTYPVKQHFLEDCGIDLRNTMKMCDGKEPAVVHEDVARLIHYIDNSKPEGAILCFLPGWDDIRRVYDLIPQRSNIATYCLHSRLQDSEQWKIFSRPPPGVRKVILATNIAETSVTIDDVVYVVDSGIHKEQRFDADKGINCIDNHWISKASATQRKGRAGRVQAGESFHLYPRSKFDSFSDYSLPEIMRTSLTKIVLDSKVLNKDMNAADFMEQLLTPPESNAVLSAVDELKDLELLDDNEKLTPLGRALANFQLEPKLSKAMVHSVIFKCATPIVDIVTLFSSETELFVSGLLNKVEVKRVKKQFSMSSDHLAMMRVFEKWLEVSSSGDSYQLRNFCDQVNLVPHKMGTIGKLRDMHFEYLYKGLYDVIPICDEYSDNDELVKAVLFSGVGSVLIHRDWDIVKNRFKKNTNVLITRNKHRATITSDSVNFKRSRYPSSFLVYINETRSNIRRTTIVRECSLIPAISVLLFSNKNLSIKEVENDLGDISVKDNVKLVLEDTNLQIICDRKHAEDIVKCKNAIKAFKNYYIRQLTCPGEPNDDINGIWDDVLKLVHEVLQRNRIQE